MQVAGSAGRIVPETLDLVHAFMQDRHDPDRPVGQQPPVDVVTCASHVETVDAERGGDGAPGQPTRRDILETGEEATDVGLRLGLAPGIAAVGVDIVETTPGRFLNPKAGYVGQRRALRAKTASASSRP